MKRPIALLLAPVWLAGCYTYSVIDPTAATPGMGVRARVSEATAERFGPSLGMTDARLLTGTLTENAGGALTIEVPSTLPGTAGSERALVQRISINRGDVIELESRKLDQGRTALAIGAGAVAAGALLSYFVQGHSSGGDAVPVGPSNFNVGIFRFRF
jgi:hypothetical protein